MPYESFPCQHHITIRGLVQDTSTGGWRFLLHVKRTMQGRTRPHAYAIRRTYAEFKRLHLAINPAVMVLPKLPMDSLFSFFVGETQTVLQKKRLILEAILKAVENHPRASESAAFLEFIANTDTYEQYSDAPPSPSGSFKDFSASYEIHKASHNQQVLSSATVRHHSHPSSTSTLTNTADYPRRRKSTLGPMRGGASTNDFHGAGLHSDPADPHRPRRHSVEAAMENCVEFSRYSQT
jgi:hypothetical protein